MSHLWTLPVAVAQAVVDAAVVERTVGRRTAAGLGLEGVAAADRLAVEEVDFDTGAAAAAEEWALRASARMALASVEDRVGAS